MKDKNLSQIRNTAKEILGAALSDLIPQGFLLKGGTIGSFFYYDIILGEDLLPVMLPHLENRMAEIAKKNHPIKVHEMIPSNAFEFFRSRRRFYPASFVKGLDDPLVKVIQIDAFIDYVEGEFLENTGELESIKLLKIEERPKLILRGDSKNVYRIIGAIGDKRESFQDPLKLGEELGLFFVKISRGKDFLEKVHLHWKGAGEALFFRVYEKWRRKHLEAGFELVIGGGDLSKPGRFAEYSDSEKCDHATTVCLEKDLVSNIQKGMKLIEELVPIEGKWEGEGPKEFQDTFHQLGLEWKKGKEFKINRKESFLTVKKNKEYYTIVHSAYPSLERLILYILEDPEKDLSQKKELLGKVGT